MYIAETGFLVVCEGKKENKSASTESLFLFCFENMTTLFREMIYETKPKPKPLHPNKMAKAQFDKEASYL